MDIEQIKGLIRDVPDFPEPGIVFKDITPVLADPIAFSTITDLIVVGSGEATWTRSSASRRGGSSSPRRSRITSAPASCRSASEEAVGHRRRGLRSNTAGPRWSCTSTASTRGAGADRRRRARAPVARPGRAASLVEQVGGKVCGIATVIELDFLHGRERLVEHELYLDPLLTGRD